MGLTAFAERSLGLTLWPGQAAVLDGWDGSGKRKALFCLGRRSGKGLMSAVAAIHNAVVPDYRDFLRPGETRFVLVVATREQQAREFVRVVRELLEAAPDERLAAMVDGMASSADEVRFVNGVVIRAMPCSSRAGRGLAASMVIFDEAAHMLTDTEGYAAFKQVWRALTPSVSQFGDRGYLMVTSTPLWPSGWFYELFRAGETGADRDLHVVRRPTWEVNAAISRESLEGEFQADPDGARVEYGAEFGTGAGAFLDPVSIYAAQVAGRRHLPPLLGQRYRAAIDPAFAKGGDAFALAIAHQSGGTVVLDRLDSWRGKRSPLSSDAVLDEIAGTLRDYGVREVVSDQFAVVPIADGLRRRGIALVAQPLTSELKADIFTALKRSLNLGELELLDHPQLASELVHLELRPSPAGKPRIAAAGGGHDDLAMVTATVVHALMRRSRAVYLGVDSVPFRRSEAAVAPPAPWETKTRPAGPPAPSSGHGCPEVIPTRPSSGWDVYEVTRGGK